MIGVDVEGLEEAGRGRRKIHSLRLAINAVAPHMHESKISQRIEDDGGVLDEILSRSEEKCTIIRIEYAIYWEENVRCAIPGSRSKVAVKIGGKDRRLATPALLNLLKGCLKEEEEENSG